jgi:hypothetical protein
VVTWLNASFEMRFRQIGGLTVRFAVSQDREDREGQALLLSPWPESLLAFELTWEDAATDYAALITSWWRSTAGRSRK